MHILHLFHEKTIKTIFMTINKAFSVLLVLILICNLHITVCSEQLETFEKMQTNSENTQKESVMFSIESGFYPDEIVLELLTETAADIYYSLDGSIPSRQSVTYACPIKLNANEDGVQAYVVRAIAIFPDGSESQVSTRSFFIGQNINNRFSTLVFSIVTDPANLYELPTGIFLQQNLMKHGMDSEREIYLEVFTPEGDILTSQNAGMRVNGASSRLHDIKSLKLFARKQYDKQQKVFPQLFFDWSSLEGNPLQEYKRIVLRNAGNDNVHAFIRDEFIQCLAGRACYPDYERVQPVVTFLNGEYYALHWLHESYSDHYFQSKYGGGTYSIIEGSETHMEKSDPKEEEYDPLADSFNHTYNMLRELDMTKESNYQLLCSFIDVDNYLDYYALNLFVGNYDWPNNNVRAFKYVTDGKSALKGTQDGRWRFLPHDLDYSLGLYGEEHTAASYNHLADVMTEGNLRYSPLFTSLMNRYDCREYFVNRIYNLMNGAFSTGNMLSLLDTMDAERSEELRNWYIPKLKSEGVGEKDKIDLNAELEKSMDQIRRFCIERPAFMESFLNEQFS